MWERKVYALSAVISNGTNLSTSKLAVYRANGLSVPRDRKKFISKFFGGRVLGPFYFFLKLGVMEGTDPTVFLCAGGVPEEGGRQA